MQKAASNGLVYNMVNSNDPRTRILDPLQPLNSKLHIPNSSRIDSSIHFRVFDFNWSWFRCFIAFGADQIQAIKNSERERVLERLFMFYCAISSLAVINAFTVTAKMLDKYGWKESSNIFNIHF
ncbi:hypothetical protein SLE2022_288390 [Rubroshorea leprosula]